MYADKIIISYSKEVTYLENIVSVSVLSADASRLADACKTIEKSGAKWLHFDVMDGLFVNNISFGVPVLQAVDKCTDMFLDVHLMIQNPLKYIDSFADAGADLITFHYESDSDISETISKIKSKGIKVGLSIKPDTSAEEIFKYIPEVDMILVMTVEPGFGGQGFIYEMIEKIKTLREYINSKGFDTDIQVDGGINAETAKLVREAGANILVSGSYLFKADNMADAVSSLIC